MAPGLSLGRRATVGLATAVTVRITEGGGMGDSSEYALLESRGFKDYSVGHQKMYTGPIELLQDKDKRWNVIDVGVGIGFGLRKMVDAGILERYIGVEPHPLSYGYTARQEWPANVTIHPCGWMELPDDQLMLADYMFCIEVIEHVPEPQVAEFLARMRTHVRRNLFLSTPDITKTAHGTATVEQWRARLKAASFTEVAVVDSQWTVLYVCE